MRYGSVPGVDAVVFDLEGTINWESPEFRAVKNGLRVKHFAELHGLSLEDEQGQQDAIAAYKAAYQRIGSHTGVFHELTGDRAYWPRIRARMNIADYMEPNGEVADLFRDLHDSEYSLFLFTNLSRGSSADRGNIDQQLTYLGIDPLVFDGVVSIDDVVAPKPHPHGYEILEGFANTNPSRILMFSDVEDKDLRTASLRGWTTVHVGQQGRSTQDFFSNAYIDDLTAARTILFPGDRPGRAENTVYFRSEREEDTFRSRLGIPRKVEVPFAFDYAYVS